MFPTIFVKDIAKILANLRVAHCFNVQIVVAKRWGGVGRLVTYVGAAAVDAMAAMEKCGLYPALGAFKNVESIMCDQFREIVGYIDWTKSTLPGLKKVIHDVKKAHMWLWHILLLDVVVTLLVDISRGTLLLNRHLFSCDSMYPAEIAASFRFIRIMCHAHPCVTILICSHTRYYRNGQKAMCNCVPPKGSLWPLDLV